jgi:hypothetical protein
MALVKLEGDRLLIHDAIALRDADMAELEAWETPTYLLVPNSFHRQDAGFGSDVTPRSRRCARRVAPKRSLPRLPSTVLTRKL